MDWGYSVPFCHYALCSKVTGLARILSYVHPRVVPTYSGGYLSGLFNVVGYSVLRGAILTLDIRTSIHAHSPGSQISIHREFYAEHIGTGLELILRSMRNLCRSLYTLVSAVGLFRPAWCWWQMAKVPWGSKLWLSKLIVKTSQGG